MDSITDFYNYEPAIALLYFLVFLLPFSAAMFYMIRQHNRWKRNYAGLYERLWAMAEQTEVELEVTSKEQLGGVITEEQIEVLEKDLNVIEEKVGVGKQTVISRKYAAKPEKIKWLEKRVSKLEKAVLQGAVA